MLFPDASRTKVDSPDEVNIKSFGGSNHVKPSKHVAGQGVEGPQQDLSSAFSVCLEELKQDLFVLDLALKKGKKR